MTREEERELRAQLARLMQEHRDLDAAIAALFEAKSCDHLLITRLKKRKLQLKDEIARMSAGDVHSRAATVLTTANETSAKLSHPKSIK